MNKNKKIILDGLIFSNPTFILVLGTCPTLSLIKTASGALGMGLSVIFVLTMSNMIISALRKIIPNEVRIPCYIVIIAALVTLVRMVLQKFLPDLYETLGGFLELIVVNCIILGRAEAFANKHTVLESALDGVSNGLGFTLALTLMGIICEFLGMGSFFGLQIMSFKIAMFTNSAGTFIIYGLSICAFTAIVEAFQRSKRVKANKLAREKMLGSLPRAEHVKEGV